MTVYILGAGASRHVGYPLAANMGAELLDWMPRFPGNRYTPWVKFISENFGNSPNIEDLITEIASEIKSLVNNDIDTKSRRSLLGTCQGRITEAIREWFREIHLCPAQAYALFATNIIRSGDVIITFNYDDSLDRELKIAGKWHPSSGYGFPLGNSELRSEALLLKLHGSINWLVSIFGGVTQGAFAISDNLSLGTHPVIHHADLDYLGCADFTGHVYPGGGAFPALILPGRTKEFFYDTSFGLEFADFWNALWLQAASALSRADNVIVCGYSLLPVDERARDLILRGPMKSANITVVSSSQTERIVDDFRKAGFKNVNAQGGYFENWVGSLSAAA